jgi:hypothetical protein
MLLDNHLIRAPTGDHSAYKQEEAEAMTPKANAHSRPGPVNGLEAFHNLR